MISIVVMLAFIQWMRQEPQIYLSDPLGIETVLMKQSDVFELPECVFTLNDISLRSHQLCLGSSPGEIHRHNASPDAEFLYSVHVTHTLTRLRVSGGGDSSND